MAVLSPPTHAAYVSWTFSLAREQEPVGRGSSRCLLAMGQCGWQKTWSVESLVALNTDLVAAGALRLNEGQAVQRLQRFPDHLSEEVLDIDPRVRLFGDDGKDAAVAGAGAA